MKTLDQMLAEQPFFKGLREDHLVRLAECGSLQEVDGGEFLFREGEPARAFYVLRQGKIAITSLTPHEGLVTIQTLGQGDVLGWSWILPPFRWHFGARALEPTVVIGLDAACVRGKCDADAGFGYEIMRRFALVMASRLAATQARLITVYQHPR